MVKSNNPFDRLDEMWEDALHEERTEGGDVVMTNSNENQDDVTMADTNKKVEDAVMADSDEKEEKMDTQNESDLSDNKTIMSVEERHKLYIGALVVVKDVQGTKRGCVIGLDDANGRVHVKVKPGNDKKSKSRNDKKGESVNNNIVDLWISQDECELLVESQVLHSGKQESREKGQPNLQLWCVTRSSVEGDAAVFGSVTTMGGYSEGTQLQELPTSSTSFRCFRADLFLGKSWSKKTWGYSHPIGMLSLRLFVGGSAISSVCMDKARSVFFLVDDDLCGDAQKHALTVLVDIMLATNPKGQYLESAAALMYQFCSGREYFWAELCLSRTVTCMKEAGCTVYQPLTVLWIVGFLRSKMNADNFSSFLSRHISDWDVTLKVLQEVDIVEADGWLLLYQGWEAVLFDRATSKHTPLQLLTSGIVVYQACKNHGRDFVSLPGRLGKAIFDRGGDLPLLDALPEALEWASAKGERIIRLQFDWTVKFMPKIFHLTPRILSVYLHNDEVYRVLSRDLSKTISDISPRCSLEDLSCIFKAMSQCKNPKSLPDKHSITLEIFSKNPHFKVWSSLTSSACLDVLGLLHATNSLNMTSAWTRTKYKDALRPKVFGILEKARDLVVLPKEKNTLQKAWNWVWGSEEDDEKKKFESSLTESAMLVANEVVAPLVRLTNIIGDVLYEDAFVKQTFDNIRRIVLARDGMSPFTVAKYWATVLSTLDEDSHCSIFRKALTETIINHVTRQAHDLGSKSRHELIFPLIKQLRDWKPDMVADIVISIASMDVFVGHEVSLHELTTFSETLRELVQASKVLKSEKLVRYCEPISRVIYQWHFDIVQKNLNVGDVEFLSKKLASMSHLWISVLGHQRFQTAAGSITEQASAVEQLQLQKQAYRSSVSPIITRFGIEDCSSDVLKDASPLTVVEFQRALTSCCYGQKEDILRVHELACSRVFEIILENAVNSRENDLSNPDCDPSLVCREVIPAALSQLYELLDLLHGSKLTRYHAEQWFRSVQSRLRKELELMFDFSRRHWSMEFDTEIQRRLLEDFFLFEKNIAWLKVLIQFRELFSSQLFRGISYSSDPMCAELESFLKEIEKSNDDQLLESFTAPTNKYRRYLESISSSHVELVEILCADSKRSSQMFTFLLEYKEDEKFRSRADLFRECVAEPLLLGALACLVSIRVKVTQPLTKNFIDDDGYAFPGLQGFVEALGQLDLDSSQNKELSCVLESFGGLLGAMKENSLTPGVKAFWRLVKLRQRGVYVISPASASSEVSVTALIVADPRVAASAVGGRKIIEEQVEEKLTLRDLEQLHALCLMTEIQPEIAQRIRDDTGANLRALVDSLGRGEIGMLKSIYEILLSLLEEGHPLCSCPCPDTLLVVSDDGALDVIGRMKNHFLRIKADFVQIVGQSRERNAFLNFFTVSELHQITSAVIDFSFENKSVARLSDALRFASRRELVVEGCDLRLRDMATRLQKLQSAKLDCDEDVVSYFDCTEEVLEYCSYQLDSSKTKRAFDSRLLRRSNKANIPLSTAEDEFWVALQDSRLRKKNPVVTASFPDSLDGLKALLSVYARLGGAPEPSEVMLCESETSLEAVGIFLHRWESCESPEWLFTLFGVEKLSLEAQSLLCKRVLSTSPRAQESAFLLVMQTGDKDVKVLNCLAHLQVEIIVPESPSAGEAIRHSLEACYGQESVFFVQSPSSGSGKTSFILERAFSLNAEAAVLTATMDEHTSRKSLGQRLQAARKSLGRDSGQPILWHIDIAHRTPENVTYILVELLLFGRIGWSTQRGRQSDAFYRLPGETFAIELQFSADQTHRSLEALNGYLFESHVINGTAQDYSALEYQRYQPTGKQQISVVRSSSHHRSVAARFVQLIASNSISNTMILEPDALIEQESVDHAIECFRTQIPNLIGRNGSMRSIDALVRTLSFWGTALDRWALCYPGILEAEADARVSWRAVFASLVQSTALSFSRRKVPHIAVQDCSSENQVRQFAHLEHFHREPLLVLKRNDRVMDEMEIGGIEILSFDSGALKRRIGCNALCQVLQHNGLDVCRDWSNLGHEEAIRLLMQADGHWVEHAEIRHASRGYVFSVDNFLKMLIIHTRLSVGIPVVIMGETGCGKTSILEEMCSILGWQIATHRIHGGVNRVQVEEWMKVQIDIARGSPGTPRLAFLDEINTADCMGLFKQIICDRILQGIGLMLPDNLYVVAACNPYRLKSDAARQREERDGLLPECYWKESSSLQYRRGSGPFRDPLRHLVYRVHPLPESMMDYVFDFGALSSETEAAYINAIVARRIPNHPSLAKSISVILSGYQETTRAIHESERSVVSLRDVSRFLEVLEWSMEHWYHFEPRWSSLKLGSITSDDDGHGAVQDLLSSCISIASLFCYYSRLTFSQRGEFVEAMLRVASGGTLHPSARAVWRSEQSWKSLSDRVQKQVVDAMKLRPGIARNSALNENILMLFVAIMSRTPIIVVGKPGSSKSLAMSLIRQSVRGAESKGPLSKFPAVAIFSYQCSPLSTASGIEKVFKLADQTGQGSVQGINDNGTIQVVLLDEVGLAEQSEHLPLKVLHKLLDERSGRVSVVGLSNWALDPAKMNRAVHLFRPAPSRHDLSITAKAITDDPFLGRHLINLADAYYEVYQSQSQDDFFGLRDFYSLVRTLSGLTKTENNVDAFDDISRSSRQTGLSPEVLAEAVLRNFGGRPRKERDKLLKIFYERVGMNVPASLPGIEGLIRSNLKTLGHTARHLLLLTRNDAALHLLFEQKLVDEASTIIIGSDFAGDQDELRSYDALEKIRACMSSGKTAVLLHCERLYESLYDVLNQHYSRSGDQTYTRLAFGPESQPCYIHDAFRMVVIVEATDAYSGISPALLNRFEKQCLDRTSLLTAENREMMNFLENNLLKPLCSGGLEPRDLIPGFHDGILASLVQLDDPSLPNLVRRFLDCCDSEPILLLTQSDIRNTIKDTIGVDPLEIYFEDQEHNSLDSLVNSGRLQQRSIVLTFSAFNESRHTDIVLHSIDSEKEFELSLTNALEQKSLIIIQCDANLLSRRRLLQAMYRVDGILQNKPASVILVVHVRRGTISSSFFLDFSDRWYTVFVDGIQEDEITGDLRTLVASSLVEILGEGSVLSLKKALRRTFRRSILRVAYPYRRTDDDIRSQIALLDDQINNHPRFVNFVRNFFLHVMEHRPLIRRHLERLWNVLGSKRRCGSLLQSYHAAFDLIIEQLLGLLFAYIEENNCSRLLCKETDRDQWYFLANQALMDSSSIGVKYERAFCMGERFAISTVGNRPTFDCLVPFSSFVHDKITSRRTAWETMEQVGPHELLLLLPSFIEQMELDSDSLSNLVGDIYYLMFARRHDGARHLQDKVIAIGPKLLVYLLKDLGADVAKLEGIIGIATVYNVVWKNHIIVEAFFDVLRKVPFRKWDDLAEAESLLETVTCAAVSSVGWKPDHSGSRLAIKRLIDVSGGTPPATWNLVRFFADVMQEAPQCVEAIERQASDFLDNGRLWDGDPLQFKLPVDAYLAVDCEPGPLLERTSSSFDASIQQCFSVLSSISRRTTKSFVKDWIQGFVSSREMISKSFSSACVLFLSAQHQSQEKSVFHNLQNQRDLRHFRNWNEQVFSQSLMHAAVSRSAETLETNLLRHCDENIFIHEEAPRWLFWNCLARNHGVSEVQRLIENEPLRSLQISALHNVRLPVAARKQPPFNPFGPIDERVYAATAGGDAMETLRKAWRDPGEKVALSVATYWWRLTTDLGRVPPAERQVLSEMKRDLLPLDSDGFLWGLQDMDMVVEIILVFVFAGSEKTTNPSLWSQLTNNLCPTNFLPGLPDDKTRIILSAVNDGTAVYQCPNGHFYFIGNCGQPNEASRCATCGSPIGGGGYHRAHAGNRVANIPRETELRGYFLERLDPGDQSIYDGDRGHSALEIALYRALLHVAALVHTDCTWMGRNMNDHAVVSREFRGNWRAFAVHQLRTSLSQVARAIEVELAEAAAMTIQLIDRIFTEAPTRAVGSFANAFERLSWEQELKPLISTTVSHDRAPAAMTIFAVGGEGRQGLTNLLNDLRSGKNIPREDSSFWIPLSLFNFAMMEAQLKRERLEPSPVTELLDFIFQHQQEIKALRHVPGAVQWLTLCHQKFDLRLSRSEAREKLVHSELEDDSIQSAYHNYCDLWISLFPNLQYECMNIPEHLRSMTIDGSTSLIFSLLTEEDEGLCPGAVMQRVQEVQNRLVHLSRVVVRNEDSDDAENREDWIPLRLFDASQIAYLDIGDVMAYAERACFDPCARRTSKALDLTKLARFVAEQLHTKPLVQCQLPAVRFVGRDEPGTSALGEQLHALLSNNSDVALQEMHREGLERELHNAETACIDLQTLQTILRFIIDTQDSEKDLGELKLETFAVEVLRMSKPVFRSPTLASTALLKHGSWLLRKLAMLATEDPAAGVLPKYNQSPSPEVHAELVLWAEESNKQVVQAVKEALGIICRDYFTQGNLSAKEKLSELLSFRDELENVNHRLPPSLLCEHAVPVLKFLSS